MTFSDIQWGWRVQCFEPGCIQCLEKWGPVKGVGEYPWVPGLPGDTYRQDQLDGWYFNRFPKKRQMSYRAYCPEHAKQVWDWKAEVNAWWKRRDAEASGTVSTLTTLLQTLGLTKHVAEKMRNWEALNPKPLPPWENTDD